MPTGYTADIAKGISFETYALECARAFGALMLMRDDPKGTEIPKSLEVSSYHVDKLKEAQDELTRLEHLSDSDITELALVSWKREEETRKNYMKENMELRIKYEDMLTQVNAWVPPSAEHIKYHEFMKSQIIDSIKWDCNEEHYKDPIGLTNNEDWLLIKTKAAIRNIAYHTKEYKAEVARNDGKNEWLNQLRDSLEIK